MNKNLTEMTQKTFDIKQEFHDQGFTYNQVRAIVEIITNTDTDEFQKFVDFIAFGQYRKCYKANDTEIAIMETHNAEA